MTRSLVGLPLGDSVAPPQAQAVPQVRGSFVTLSRPGVFSCPYRTRETRRLSQKDELSSVWRNSLLRFSGGKSAFQWLFLPPLRRTGKFSTAGRFPQKVSSKHRKLLPALTGASVPNSLVSPSLGLLSGPPSAFLPSPAQGPPGLVSTSEQSSRGCSRGGVAGAGPQTHWLNGAPSDQELCSGAARARRARFMCIGTPWAGSGLRHVAFPG